MGIVPKSPAHRPERELTRWLLEHGTPGAEKLLPQIDRLTVIGKCTCGCPTVDFALDGEPVPHKDDRVISEYLADVDGEHVGVMLFGNNGRISTLDVYSRAGTLKPFGLPAIESLYSWEDYERKRAENNPQ